MSKEETAFGSSLNKLLDTSEKDLSQTSFASPVSSYNQKWFDEGRAAAMQKLTHRHNPFREDTETEQFDAWIKGFNSFGSRHLAASDEK